MADSSIAPAILLAAALGLNATALVAAAEGPSGSWAADAIAGASVIAGQKSTLAITPSGEVSGSGGCNSFHGQAKIAGHTIEFGPLAATRMACEGRILDQETKFFKALEDVRQFERDEAHGRLSLRDARGREILRLSEAK